MATQPTNLPVPSESPRDLKFNAGKIDEFVTSLALQYLDRFGNAHYTIEGLKQLVLNQIYNLGWNPIGTFQGGAVIIAAGDVIQDETNDVWYRWDDLATIPKTVPPGSTPDSTGGIGAGKWIAVDISDVLRKELDNGQYRTPYTAIKYVSGVVMDTTTDNRNVIFAHVGKIYIPEGTTIRCNFLPDDDVRKFVGEGTIISRTTWGTDQAFDVNKSCNGSLNTASGLISSSALTKTVCTIGVLGDSISDGATSNGWTHNPTDSTSGNLNSVNYNHDKTGAINGWVNKFGVLANNILVDNSSVDANDYIRTYNISSSSKKLADGWAYRNFDYGFFQNIAYGKKAPNVLFITMGANDKGWTDINQYLDRFDALIRKAWGYGCAVALISMEGNVQGDTLNELSIKESIERLYPTVQYYDLMSEWMEFFRERSSYSLTELAYRADTGAFDQLHPANEGHSILSAMLMKKMFPGFFIFADKERVASPQTSTDVHFWSYGSDNENFGYAVPSLNSKVGAWAKVRSLTAQCKLSMYVWAETSDSECTVVEISSPTYTSSGRNNVYSVIMNSRVNSVARKGPAQLASGINSATSLSMSTNIGKLKKGLNIIDFVYDGLPSEIWIPALVFSKRRDTAFGSGRFKGLVAAGSDGTLTMHNIEAEPIFDKLTSSSYVMDNVKSSVPDVVSNGLSSSLAWSVYIKDGLKRISTSVPFVFSYKANEGYGRVVRINSSTGQIAVNSIVLNKIDAAIANADISSILTAGVYTDLLITPIYIRGVNPRTGDNVLLVQQNVNTNFGDGGSFGFTNTTTSVINYVTPDTKVSLSGATESFGLN